MKVHPAHQRLILWAHNDLADVGRCDLEAKDGGVLIHDGFYADGIRVVDKGLGNLADERTNLGDRVRRLKRICHYSTSKARTGVFIADFLQKKG